MDNLKEYALNRVNVLEHDILKETNIEYKKMYQSDLKRWKKILESWK